MALKLVIRSRGKGGLGTKSSHVFDGDGGTIGRGGDCTWVLVDPRNEVSSLHATIVQEAGRYCLVDESTNGVFVNGSSRPIGRGVKVALRHGDVLRIGQYEVGVVLGSGHEDVTMTDLSVADGYGLADLVSGDDPYGDPERVAGGDHDPSVGYKSFASVAKTNRPDADMPPGGDASASATRRSPAPHHRLDPLAALDQDAAGASDRSRREDARHARFAGLDVHPPTHRPVTEEDAAGGITGNFVPQTVHAPAAPAQDFERYLESLASPGHPMPDRAAGSAPRVQQPSAPDRTGIDAIDGAMTTLSPAHHNLWPLLEALGLTRTPVPDDRVPGVLADVGEALRQAISALHATFSTANRRSDPAFRIAGTQLQPLEDNPIKFADTADQAITLLFGERHPVHLGPKAAVAECLDGMALHREAVAAGTAAGLQAVVGSFAPEALARRFAKYDPERSDRHDRAWLWHMFEQYFDELQRNQAHGLDRLFDEVFTETYDRHIRATLAARDEPSDDAPSAPAARGAPSPQPSDTHPPPRGPGGGPDPDPARAWR